MVFGMPHLTRQNENEIDKFLLGNEEESKHGSANYNINSPLKNSAVEKSKFYN